MSTDKKISGFLERQRMNVACREMDGMQGGKMSRTGRRPWEAPVSLYCWVLYFFRSAFILEVAGELSFFFNAMSCC